MAATRLVFQQPRHTGGNPVPLVFGAGGQAEVPIYAITARGRITGLRGQVCMASVLQLRAQGRITGLRGTVAMGWNVNVSRPVVAHALDSAQSAQPVRAAVHSLWQQAQRNQAAVQQIWQDARHVAAQVQALWQQAQPLRGAGQDTQQDAAPVRHGVSARFEQAVRRHTAAVDAMQDAQALRSAALAAFQQAVRLRAATQAHMQQGVPVAGHWLTRFAYGLPVRVSVHGRFEQATQPGPGLWLWPQPPKPQPCYVPALPARLVFEQAYAAGLPAALVFSCGKSQPPDPGGSVIVPIRRVYIVQNSVTLLRLDSGRELRAIDFSMSLDRSSWTWNWSASLYGDDGPHLGREANGDPAELLVTINSVPFRLRLERRKRDRRFLPQERWQVSGRGRNAILGADWAPQMSFGNPAAARTAQQLALDALQINGVSLGWELDWQLDDWNVPAGAWAMQGRYIDAVLDIAQAAGGYVQPHSTDKVLRILHDYPVAPWDWADVNAPIVLPADVSEEDGTEFLDKPNYNRVFVGGVGAGVFGPFTRNGTAGEELAPQVTHALITDVTAQRQRALSVLGDTGKQTLRTITLPVLPETGIIVPGQFVRYDGEVGLVRSTGVNWRFPVLRQSLEVETHA